MKKRKESEQFIPEGAIALQVCGEGDFLATAWRHFETDVYGITCSGHLDESAWEDEGDRVRALAKALRSVGEVRASRFLWDMRALQAIDRPGLELLKTFQRRLAGRAACAVVQNGLAASVPLMTELEGCYVADTVADAITWLQDKDADG